MHKDKLNQAFPPMLVSGMSNNRYRNDNGITSYASLESCLP